MLQQYLPYVVIAGCLVALWILSPALRLTVYRWLVVKPNLRFEELPDIMKACKNFTIEKDPQKKMPGATRSIRVYNDKVSIIYHTTYQRSLLVAETVDISCAGRAGMILTFRHGRLVVLERIGGSELHLPLLTAEEQSSLEEFMMAVSHCFDRE